MNRLVYILALAFCLALLQSSSAIFLDTAKQRQARAGLDRNIAELPQLPEFTVVTLLHDDFYNNEGGGRSGRDTCYYAEANFVFGT